MVWFNVLAETTTTVYLTLNPLTTQNIYLEARTMFILRLMHQCSDVVGCLPHHFTVSQPRRWWFERHCHENVKSCICFKLRKIWKCHVP